MTYTISRTATSSVLFIEVIDSLPVYEVELISDTVLELFEHSSTPRVHLLIDESSLMQVNDNIRSISALTRMLKHPKCGYVVIYGREEPESVFFNRLFSRMPHVERFRERDEALRFLSQFAQTSSFLGSSTD